MKNKNIWIIVASILILLIIAFILKLSKGESNKQEVYQTYKVAYDPPINLKGKASPQAIKTFRNNSKVGQFINTKVTNGQSVKQGMPLINYQINNIHREELQRKINNAQNKINIDYRRLNHQPNSKLIQNKLHRDESSLFEAQRQLNHFDQQVNANIYAPFNGKVDLNSNEEIAVGAPILKLVSLETQISTPVSEFDLKKLKVGKKVKIKVISTDKSTVGKIKKISQLPTSYDEESTQLADNDMNQSSQSSDQLSGIQLNDTSNSDNNDLSKYNVVIGDLGSSIRSGYSTEIKVPLKTIKLPRSVLNRNHDVFVLKKDHTVERRDILIERKNGEIFVKKGLKIGEKLIVKPAKTMNDGDKVEVSS